MSGSHKYKLRRIDRELAAGGAVVNFYRDTMELPNGEIQRWDFIEHKRGGACVIPVLPDGKLLMVRQFRPTIDRETLEFPAGAREHRSEDTMVTAMRELEEETGYRAGTIRKLLTIKSAPAYCTEETDIYLAENLDKVGEQKLDAAEEIFLEAYSVEDLLNRVFLGELQDAKTVAGLLGYQLLKSQRKEQ